MQYAARYLLHVCRGVFFLIAMEVTTLLYSSLVPLRGRCAFQGDGARAVPTGFAEDLRPVDVSGDVKQDVYRFTTAITGAADPHIPRIGAIKPSLRSPLWI